jgi:excisionase family DNA binding protein
MDEKPDRITTVPEVADYLKISKAKIYYMMQREEIPHARIGRNVRIRETDLSAKIT